MPRATKDSGVAPLTFRLHKYAFVTAPTMSKEYNYFHVSARPNTLQLLLRPHELTNGYKIDILAGVDTLDTIDLVNIARYAQNNSQNSVPQSESPVDVRYQNLVIALRYPISLAETRRVQMKFAKDEDFILILEKLRKLGLQPHSPPSTSEPPSTRTQNAITGFQNNTLGTQTSVGTSQMAQRHNGARSPALSRNITSYNSFSSPTLPQLPLLSSDALVPLGSSSVTRTISSRNPDSAKQYPTDMLAKQPSGRSNSSIIPSSGNGYTGTTPQFFHHPPNEQDQLQAASRSSPLSNHPRVASHRSPNQITRTGSAQGRQPVESLGHNFEAALTAARNVAMNFERPVTGLSTLSDDTVVKKYAGNHNSFRSTSGGPSQSKEDIQESMPPKRILPFPSLRKGSTVSKSTSKPQTSNTSKLDTTSLTNKKRTSTTLKTGTDERLPSSAATVSRLGPQFSNASTSNQVSEVNLHPRSTQIEPQSTTKAKVTSESAEQVGENLAQHTAKQLQDMSSTARKRSASISDTNMPKRSKTMVDRSTQTWTSWREAVSRATSTKKKSNYKDQGTQTPTLPSDLIKELRRSLTRAQETDEHREDAEGNQDTVTNNGAEITAAAATSILTREIADAPGYYAMSEKQRLDLLNNYVLECVQDPNFLTLCKDFDKVWRGKVLFQQKE